MRSVKHIFEETSSRLQEIYDLGEARSVSFALLEDLFGVRRSAVLANDELEIDEHLLEKSLSRLLRNEPIQYVTGKAHFYGRVFKIQRGALIPRPETEELVQLILEQSKLPSPRVLDVGLGSGCIGISLSLELGVEVFGTDISPEAIEIANQNSINLGAKTKFSQHDILIHNLEIEPLDILVSNPPYIPENEKSLMSSNVVDFEPDEALFVPDNDPLVFYKSIAHQGLRILKDQGSLYFEIHEDYGNRIKSMLEAMGYTSVIIYQDMQGKDRMVRATNSTSK